eukprot:12630650-Alexandrium_andersonii.AAC.1
MSTPVLRTGHTTSHPKAMQPRPCHQCNASALKCCAPNRPARPKSMRARGCASATRLASTRMPKWEHARRSSVA